MPTPSQIVKQINELTKYLVEESLTDAQYFAFQRPISGGLSEVTFQNAEHLSIALKNLPYKEIYERLVQGESYNVKMLDGALIQMMYAFAEGTLQRHRLAFFSSPRLEESRRYANGLPAQDGSFDESIAPAERGIVHLVVPA